MKLRFPEKHDINPMWDLREDILKSPLSVALERAKAYTRIFSENEGAPWIVRKSMAFREHLNTVPLYIRKNDRLAGSICEIPGGMPVLAELGIGECLNFINEDPHRKGYMDGKVPSEIEEYWKDKNAWAFYRGYMKTVKGITQFPEKLTDRNFLACQGHLSPDYKQLLAVGLGGMIECVRKRKIEENAPESLEFLMAAELSLSGISEWIGRYSDFLYEESKKCTDPQRSRMLAGMSGICSRISFGAPSGFHEAMQLIWFVQQGIHIEGNGYSNTPDRIDQILYPFYLKDKQEGKIDDDEVITLCENFILKMRDNTFWSVEHNLSQGICLSGSTPEGRDQTNELSWLFIKAAANMHVPEPLVWIRWNRNIDQDFFDFCLETLADGTCFPLIMSDSVVPDMLMEMGVTREDAFDYVPVGCNEIGIPGRMYFMLAANTGDIWPIIDTVDSGKEFDDFSSFAEAFSKAMRSQIEASYAHGLDMLMVNRRWKQVPLTSCFFNGCIERGADLVERTKYNILSCGGGFFASMVDMLSSIRETVYENRYALLKELAEACTANFEGHESLQRRLKDAPRHGNDDARLIDIIKLIEDTQTEHTKEICRHPVDGTPFGITHITRSDSVVYGKVTPATPDGRLAWTPLASSVAASSGTEMNGPSALLKSIMSMNPKKNWQCGYNANIRFSRDMLARYENRQKVRQMLNVFFDNSGQELQINCVDAAILREARENPEQYRDLVVRVAGFSEFFTKLMPEIQEEIISRAEHRV